MPSHESSGRSSASTRPTKRRRERERERHRMEILTCAGDLFAQRGFEGTTMQDISSASGFALASIYKHFPGKEQIYDALVNEAVRSYVEALQGEFERFESPLERIRACVRVTVDHVERNRAVSEVILRELRGLGMPRPDTSASDAVGAPIPFTASQGYLAVLRFWEDLVVQAKERGEILPDVKPRAAALMLIGTLFVGLTYWLHYSESGERMDPEAMLRVTLGSMVRTPS